MKEKNQQSVKIKVAEADFNFLKKIVGLRKPDDILIKKVKVQEKGKKEEKEVTSVITADEALGYLVQTTQLTPAFKADKFGLANIKGFLKAINTYGEMEETDNGIIFSSDKKKITYRKLDESTIQQLPLPPVDTAGYLAIQLTQEEIKEIQDGLKNDLSKFASLIVTKDNKLKLKIGEMSFDNLFELDIKAITRKETTEIKFLTKLEYLTRLFTTLDADSKVTLYLKQGSAMICLEKSPITNTKTYIGASMSDDEESIDRIVEEGEEE